MSNPKINITLIKIDRLFAWILLILMFVYFLSGYGMTKGIIEGKFASELHLNILPLAIIIAFAIHTSLAIRLALIRWKTWNAFTKILLAAIYLSFLIGFFYIDISYIKSDTDKTSDSVKTSTTNQEIPAGSSAGSQANFNTALPEPNNNKTAEDLNTETNANNSQTVQAFNAQTLAQYNGQNGNPAYVAVDGLVYDLTSVFQNGAHYSHLAGKELTSAFYARHAKSEIVKYPVVGEYQD